MTDTIGMRINNIRTRRGMTQEQLAEMLFVNKAKVFLIWKQIITALWICTGSAIANYDN